MASDELVPKSVNFGQQKTENSITSSIINGASGAPGRCIRSPRTVHKIYMGSTYGSSSFLVTKRDLLLDDSMLSYKI